LLVTVDIGNSRLKAGLWQGASLLQHVAQDYRREAPDLPAQLRRFLAEPLFCQSHERMLVACVAGETVERALLQAAANLSPVAFFRTSAQCCGIRHAYAQPAQHGVDRWAALIGARKLSEGALCVIDVGTAVTVDLLSADDRHLGGRIMPGLNMMKTALQQGTAKLTDTGGNSSLFADNTADAIGAGVFHMLRTALDAVIDEAQAHPSLAGDDNMRVFLTGGQAAMLQAVLRQADAIRLEPALVLHGLQRVAEQT